MVYPHRRETPYTSIDFSTPGFKEPAGRSKEAFFDAMGSQRKKVENWDSIQAAGAAAYAEHGEKGPYCDPDEGGCGEHHW